MRYAAFELVKSTGADGTAIHGLPPLFERSNTRRRKKPPPSTADRTKCYAIPREAAVLTSPSEHGFGLHIHRSRRTDRSGTRWGSEQAALRTVLRSCDSNRCPDRRRLLAASQETAAISRPRRRRRDAAIVGSTCVPVSRGPEAADAMWPGTLPRPAGELGQVSRRR